MWELILLAVILVVVACIPDAEQRERARQYEYLYEQIDRNTILSLIQDEPEYIKMTPQQRRLFVEEALRIWRR